MGSSIKNIEARTKIVLLGCPTTDKYISYKNIFYKSQVLGDAKFIPKSGPTGGGIFRGPPGGMGFLVGHFFAF